MNGPLAQIVALTCFGNASIDGTTVPRFFPQNSTSQFCESVSFVELKKSFFGQAKEIVVANTPDEWFAALVKRGAAGIRLIRMAQNDPQISDRMAASFVGGGGTWMMEVLSDADRSEYWAARWEVMNQNAPDSRIWKVTYALVGHGRTMPDDRRGLQIVMADFHKSLESIHSFAARETSGSFTDCFANALRAFEEPAADVGYHKDLAPPNQLSIDQSVALKAAMCAWVFGGMGSWNDMGFDGATHIEYERVSEELFGFLNEVIEIAASSTARIENLSTVRK
jgi:hypothetical protein